MTSNSTLNTGTNLTEAYSVDFWAERLHVNAKTLYRAVTRGELECYRVGRAVRMTEKQITSFLEGGNRA